METKNYTRIGVVLTVIGVICLCSTIRVNGIDVSQWTHIVGGFMTFTGGLLLGVAAAIDKLINSN